MFRLVKKTLFIVFIISAVVFCIGCSQNDGSDKNDDKNEKENILSKPETDSSGEKKPDLSPTAKQDKQEPEDGSDRFKEEVSAKEDKTEYPAADDSPPMDPVLRMEYDRSRVLVKKEYYDTLDNTCPQTWCFERKKDHSQSGTYENFRISDYNGVYVDENVTDDDKVIYLTFDCGYPSDLTVKILDTLKKHNAKASFFVTKMYLEECSGYAKRMKEEGHMVCNHTVTHTDLVTKDVERVVKEIFDVAEYFYEMTGYEFDPYFRTPTGSYSKKLMTIIRDAGYMTVFWSIAYGDYDPDNQPAPGYVTNHFSAYHHNGAIALMHNDSPSNANELDDVLTLLENQGYRFALLDEIEIN